METLNLPLADLTARIHHIWDQKWFVLTSGVFADGEFNSMVASWGSFGTVWSQPFAQVFVRPTRYTFEFMERFPTFTLCGFEETHREALTILGTRSGRDGDKIAESGLTPIAAGKVDAPVFAEADIAIECRTMFAQDITPDSFVDQRIDMHYGEKDYHRIYFGQVVAASGTRNYLAE